MKRCYLDQFKNDICELYFRKKLTLQEIAGTYGCSFSAVWLMFNRMGIKPRTQSEAQLEAQRGKRGKLARHWKGGRKKTSDGYIMIFKSDHPNADKQGYIMEHRLIVEKSLGRYLKRDEVIHHINGNIQDNRIENLKLFTKFKDHFDWHKAEKRETKLLQKDFA